MNIAEKILNTTIKLFIGSGIKRVSMDEIAKCANVSKVTVYRHFKDKESLYLDVSKRIFSEYSERIYVTVASSDTLYKKLYAFISIVSDFTVSGKYALCVELSSFSTLIEAEYDQYMQIYRSSMLTLIDEGLENGMFKKRLSKEMIYYYIDMGVVYFQQFPGYRHKMLDESDFRKKFMQFFINNIFADGTQIVQDMV